VAASLTATITRYVAMRTWVFSRERRSIRPSLDLVSR
jgi:putative flippase GtrA